MACRRRIITALLGVLTTPLLAHAFNFTNNNPTQCDDITINWSGGEPPFRLLIIPPGCRIKNISIPSTAYHSENKSGTYTMQLPLPQSQRVMFSISDVTGITAGGISPLFTVGDSVSGANCNTASATADFWFSLDSDLAECEAYPFTKYPNASQPITIYGFVPSSQSFTIHPPIGDSYNWMNKNLVAGTSVTFSMIDSKGRDGGTSDIRVVKLSGDQSCLSTSSSSTSASPTSSSPSNGAYTPRNPQSNAGIIVGSVVGGLILASLLFLAVFWLRRRRARCGRVPIIKIKSSDDETDLLYEPLGYPSNDPYSLLPIQHIISPFQGENRTAPLSQKAQLIQSMESDSLLTPSPSPRATQFSQSSRSTNADTLLSGSYHTSSRESRNEFGAEPARVIIHTDIAETMNDPLELPPQYVAGRPPIIGLYPGSDELPTEEPRPEGRRGVTKER